ncbi:MAG: flagellar basal body-associated FliL family protein [Pseudomonadota bacterium]
MDKSSPEDQDTDTASSETDDAPAPKSRRKLILAAAAVLVLVALGGGGYVFLSSGPAEEMAEKPKEPEKKKAEDKPMDDGTAAAVNQQYAVAPFKEIIVNISSITINGQASSRFLKLNIALVYDPNAEGAERIEERQIYIRDSFVEFLRQVTERDLNGSAGLAFLKSELLHRVRLLAESDAPKDLLIADLVIQ